MKFEIRGEYIELNKLLKICDLVSSGGEAGFVIKEGMVMLDGEVETRKRKKVYPGSRVFFNGESIDTTQEA